MMQHSHLKGAFMKLGALVHRDCIFSHLIYRWWTEIFLFVPERWNLFGQNGLDGWMNRRYGRAWGSNKIIFMYIVFQEQDGVAAVQS
jgi:hypothetical protein